MKIKFLIFLLLAGCEFKPNNHQYEKPSKAQLECLRSVSLESEELLKSSLEDFKSAITSNDDESLIRYELQNRRNEEKICMLKANCYEKSKGIEFSDCINKEPRQYE